MEWRCGVGRAGWDGLVGLVGFVERWKGGKVVVGGGEEEEEEEEEGGEVKMAGSGRSRDESTNPL